jgi:hypothetical protein
MVSFPVIDEISLDKTRICDRIIMETGNSSWWVRIKPFPEQE